MQLRLFEKTRKGLHAMLDESSISKPEELIQIMYILWNCHEQWISWL